MRLIDADELMEHVYRDKLDSRELIAQMVENAPTVKEIPIKIPIDIFEFSRQIFDRSFESAERGKGMNREEAFNIIRKEYLCVDRDCDIERSCGKCDLVMPSKEPILEAFKLAMDALEHQLTETDLTEIRDRFGDGVAFVVRDMISGKGERWNE